MVSVEPTDWRKIKGEEIARKCRIKHTREGWMVPSQSKHRSYVVILKDNEPTCTCPDFEFRHDKCKHIYAVETVIRKEIDEEGNTSITKTVRMSYSQNWQAYDTAQQTEKSMFMKLLSDLCNTIEEPNYKFGRPKLSLRDMTFCSAFKVYSLYSLRRFTTDMKVAKEEKYIENVPCYASVGHFFQREELTQVLMKLIEVSSLPLKSVETEFAIDSSGFSSSRFDRWFDYRVERVKDVKRWIKAHIMCGVKTNIITSVELTSSAEHDAKFLPQLVSKTSENFDIKEVSADKGYISRDNLKIIDEIGATPFIPFRNNTRSNPRGCKIWRNMWHYFMYRHDEFLQHYHKRSKVETTFHMIKAKFGDSVKSKTKTAQINEVLCKVLCHNICVVIQEIHELGISVDCIK